MRTSARAVERGREAEAEWKERYDAWAKDNSELAADLERALRRELPDGWDSELPRFEPAGRRDRHAQGVEQGDPVGRGARCPSWSAGRPTWRRRR